MPTPSPSPARTSEQICDRIRSLIRSGHLQSGDKLPPERELAVFLGIGRGALREALRSLEIAGLVSSRKGRAGGTFINQREARPMTTALDSMMHLGTVALRDLTEARTLLMADAIRLACERATEVDFAELDNNVDLTEVYTLAGEYELRRQTATDFYRLVAMASKNQVLVVTVEASTEILREFLRLPNTHPLQMLIRSRRRFMRFLRARDAHRATREMSTYLTGLQQHIIDARFDRISVRPKAAIGARLRLTKA